MTSGQRICDHQKRGTFLFKTAFHLSRYDFRLPRYRRVKKKVIFNRLLPPSLSPIRISRSHLLSPTYPKLQTRVRRDSWKSVVRISKKKCRSVGYGSIHDLCTVLSATETSNRYNSATVRDIGINQKATSMARFPLCFSDEIFNFFHAKDQSFSFI